jgi:hypothetical protein
MQLSLQNRWGYELDDLIFPSDLVFIEDDIQEVLLPILPGVVLESDFFDLLIPCDPNSSNPDRCYETDYPGWPGVFADYVSLLSNKGQFAIYSIPEQGSITPAHFGFVHDDAYISGSTYYSHAFKAKLANGNSWTSPRVRVRISDTRIETINGFRADTGIDSFRSIQEKLGPRYNQFSQLPLYKTDAEHMGISFSAYSSFLSQVLYPGILHLVAYWQRGFDENYPDFLPPASQWGTTQDMVNMFAQAKALGYAVMPYINPTWWDDESPTSQNLPTPLTVSDIAVRDEQGLPRYENYGTHGGYIVSPYASFVQQRLQQLMQQMTQNIPSDAIYEDQVGARATSFDYNSVSPNPTAYTQGWIEHTRIYSNTLLTTEMGFDRLAETETGFHGSILLLKADGSTNTWWGANTWHLYPLAPLLFRDKVFLYHNTESRTSTVTKEMFSTNLAFGYMLSYDLGAYKLQPPQADWLEVIGAFQKYVISRYAHERMTNFTNLQSEVTQSTFENFTVITNWDGAAPYSTGQYTLPISGAMTTSNDGSLVAGVFTAYNNVPLSSGDHYLIEERGTNEITVRQPMGADTNLTLQLLSNWNINSSIEVWAFAKSGQFIGKTSVSSTSGSATFTYQKQLLGQNVAFYKVFKPYKVFVPAVRK